MKIKKIINIAFLSIFVSCNTAYNVNALELKQPTLRSVIEEEFFTDMTSERMHFSAEVYRDKLYIFGGRTNTGYVNTVEILDLNTKKWTTGATLPHEYTVSAPATVLYKEKIYLLGDGSRNMYTYDIATDTWAIEVETPLSGSALTIIEMEAYDDSIYMFCGLSKKTYKYDLKTKAFTQLASIPKTYSDMSIVSLNSKMYCFGGYMMDKNSYVYDLTTNTWSSTSAIPREPFYPATIRYGTNIYIVEQSGEHSSMLEYNTENDTWKEASFSASILTLGFSEHFVRDGKVYILGGALTPDTASNKIYTYKISDTKSPEEVVEEIIEEIESGNYNNANADDIADLIDKLPDTATKEDLQNRFDNIKDTIPDIPILTPETITSNLDIYIKSENMLSLSLDTNSVTFEDYSGVEDMENLNAINLTITSSLPYEVNAYLTNEMQNADKSETLDIDVLNIKESSQNVYKQFANTADAVRLLDNQNAGDYNLHSIDLKLATSLAHKADVYKTTLRFEVAQK